ncbi:hypothetical protein [Haloplanus halobius]|uniref:hypothetical protein n=1 Tax=Haloplanus halobius TaxID=2934938 RepID=UPI00200CF60E|nr:hypothetical protein [Haloplanus sp. XH21]
MVPLQIPGLPELLVIVFMFGLWLALPAFVALVVYQFMDGRNADEERIAALEAEIEDLRNELPDE